MAKERKRFIVSIVAIQTCSYGWEAYYGEDEFDTERRGYGRTAADAINDLTTRFPRED